MEFFFRKKIKSSSVSTLDRGVQMPLKDREFAPRNLYIALNSTRKSKTAIGRKMLSGINSNIFLVNGSDHLKQWKVFIVCCFVLKIVSFPGVSPESFFRIEKVAVLKSEVNGFSRVQ